MRIRLSGVVIDSIVDGPGLRFSVFTQGCPHGCPGCHNPHTHDSAGGYDADTDDLIAQMKADPLLSGVTLTGASPSPRRRLALSWQAAPARWGLTYGRTAAICMKRSPGWAPMQLRC